jgi:glycosyltransferase involved in cell wall biosynthesis
MRILFLSPIGQIGGAERVLLDLIAGIRSAEPAHELHVLTMDDGPLAEAARGLGAQVTVLVAPQSVRSLGDSGSSSVRLLWQALRGWPATRQYRREFLRAIEELNPDVIHSNGLKCHGLASCAQRDRPVIWHIHDFVSARPMVARMLRRFAHDAIPVAVSQAVADDIRKWLPASSPQMVLNGIDTDRFSPAPGDGKKLDELAGLPEAPQGTVRVGLVAAYARWKGQDVFLRAAGKILRDDLSATMRFYIVGGPIYTTRGSQFSRDELSALAQQLGVSRQMGFVTFQNDPAPVYRALDVVVHASTKPEPFGLTIAEAMACGRAVIVSAAGGAAELFTPDYDALAIPPGDPESMAAAILRLAKDPQLRESLAQRARETAVMRFSRNRMAIAILSVYSQHMEKS